MEWYLIALVSAFFSACAAILEKKILFKDKALSMSFILSIFNLILCLPFFFFINYSSLSGVALGVLFVKSILGAFAFLLVMYGIKNLEISKALPLLVLTPVFVGIFAFFILGESLSVLEITGMLLIILGTYILQLGGGSDFLYPIKILIKTRGHYYIFGALAIFTATSVLDKLILVKYNVSLNIFMGFQHLFYAIFFLALGLFFLDKKDIKKSFQFSWKIIGALALITIIYRYSEYYAISVAPVALVLSLKRISIFFAVLIGGILFKDKNLLIRIIATAIIVAGAILIILS